MKPAASVLDGASPINPRITGYALVAPPEGEPWSDQNVEEGIHPMLKNIIVSLSIAAGFGLASSASAASFISSWQVRGNGAFAQAFNVDDCRYVMFDIGANEEVVHSGGGAPTSSAGAWVGYWVRDWCTDIEIYGSEYVEGANFAGNQWSASVSISFPVNTYKWVQTPDGNWEYTWMGTDTVTAEVRWTGVGDAQRGMFSWVSRWGRTMSRSRWMGSSREADVTMNVTVDGRRQTFDFAYGELGRYHSGSTYVYSY
jgi:hypothetical protein